MIAFATFVVATGLTVALGALVRRTAPTLGAVVPPRPDRWHSRPTPTMGGVAFTAGAIPPFFGARPRNSPDPPRKRVSGVPAAAPPSCGGWLFPPPPPPPPP